MPRFQVIFISPPVLSVDELHELQNAARRVVVDDSINEYILDPVEATRKHDELDLGVSTRGAITLYHAARSLALLPPRRDVRLSAAITAITAMRGFHAVSIYRYRCGRRLRISGVGADRLPTRKTPREL